MSGPSNDLPAKQPLDRAALERVLARAAELQGAEGEGGEDQGLTDQQLIEIAKEVGLGPVHLRQALAEERTRLEAPAARGTVDHLFGPATAHAMRTVRGTADAQLAALDALMQQEEGLRVKRRYGNRVMWERAPGIVANLTRAFDMAGRGYHLARTDEIAATAVIVDDERTVVTIEASLAGTRARNISAGVALAMFGAIGTGILFVLGVMPLVAAVPVVVLGIAGFITARIHRGTLIRAQLALEQTLDRLERNEPPRKSLLAQIVAPTRPNR
jgi:hypothetical protein